MGGDRNPALIWPGCSLFYYSSRPRSHHRSLVVDYGLPGLLHRLYLSRYKAAEVIRYPMRYPKPAEKIARLEASRLGWSLSVGYFLCSYIKIAQSVGDGCLERPLVPRAGLEPARANAHQILSLARLPIPPPRHERTLQNYWLLYHVILALDKGIFLFFW